MVAVRTLKRAALVLLMSAGAAVWYACTDHAPGSPTGPTAPPPVSPPPDLRGAIAAQRRHTDAILEIPGVVGTAVTVLPDGRAGMQILVERAGIAGLPVALDGVPVTTQVTGRLMAFSDPTQRHRPAPLGFSVGHPAITAGTIGARVRDALGRVYILSNNHVLANSNGAIIGDPEYQPGPYDGGTAADQIATLSDFETITFSAVANNMMDAAIALSSAAQLGNATPSDDGYGMPSANIFGDANGDGLFDDRNALLGLSVQKYGRTTGLTHGQITGVNATVLICYEVTGISCTKFARFVDQVIITPGGFSGGGDSGSLIVTDDANLQPVALLFAGSETQTIGSRIDLVLDRFGVTIDGFEPPPPGPFTDLAVTGVGTPVALAVDSTTSVTVTVKNVGNQDVPSGFDVTLQDVTEVVTVGTQSVPGLAVGDSATVTFQWTPGSTGEHTLVGSHALIDDKATNNQSSATVGVSVPLTDLAVTTVSAPGSVKQGDVVNVAVTVGNVGNLNVGSSFVVTLEDATAGMSIGTETVPGLAVGSGAVFTFSWNTTGAALGGHALVATHGLADDNAANNERTASVTVIPKATDLALTSITGPGAVIQGDTAHIGVTVKNVGEQDVATGFDVVLTDATFGTPIDTQSVPGLALGASVTLDLPWNTAGVSITGHTLIAQQMLADDNSTNNAMAIGILVNTPPTAIDIAVTALSAPGAVNQGSTVSVGVTVQNVGQQNVSSSFNVVLTDATAGVTIGTQTVGPLAVGAAATINYNWSTIGATLGSHTLVATHTLADQNATNNERTAVVTVNPPVTDIALTSFTGPGAVPQGDTAHYAVTVQNVGGADVGVSFNVVLTDAGVETIGTQAVDGLAAGATATLDFPWNTAGTAVTGHTLIAQQMLPDNNSTNNARAIGVLVAPPVNLVTDVAVTGVSAPGSVVEGQVVSVTVTVGNIGNQDVSSGFGVVLQDTTAGVTIGTQTVTGLGVGASATLSFSWNTTDAAPGGHTLVATHDLSDANAGNDQGSAVVTVTETTLDIAVTSLAAPTSLTQGDTATIGVTVQNVGQQDHGASIDVVLTDATTGVTISTQVVPGLTVGAAATLTFTWNTSGAALGGHTLVASHNVTDDNATNNQRSTTVTVNPKVVDIALTRFTGPSSVHQGDTAHYAVTVQNLGGQDVGTSFDVVLNDAGAGVTIGTQAVAGLAVGASTTLDFPWNTATAAVTGHTLIAQQMLPDNNPTNNASAIGVLVTPPVVLVTDVAVTGVSAPGSAAEGEVVDVVVTVGNVGNQNVAGGFGVTLQDATAGVTLGTQTVAALAAGTSTTLTFGWNTAGAAAGGHTLVATQNLADDNAANDQGAAVVTLTQTTLDIAIASLSAPASVTQGNTASVGVTVQNVGEEDVGAGFDVVLTDATAGVTIGTQTVPGLTLGAGATLAFSWSTTGAALGGHTLVATHGLTDDNASNNQRSATVTVKPNVIDLAVTSLTGPASVTQGDTAHFAVTVQNVAGQDVSTSFDVTLTDAGAGVIGTQAVSGLAAGASATLDFAWGTAGAATGGHTLIAQQLLADNNAANNSRAIALVVNAPSIHVGNLNGVSERGGNTWSAIVEITVHDGAHNPVSGATVSGSWGWPDTGTCTTGADGTCSVVSPSYPNWIRLVAFSVSGMTKPGHQYQSSANHDPDGSSNGWSVFVRR